MDRVKRFRNYLQNATQYASTLMRLATTRSPRMILIGTPEHGNLGDHAITVGVHEFVGNNLPGIAIVEVPLRHYGAQRERVGRLIRSADTILIIGGGSMGTLWPKAEEIFRDIVLRFPHNRIVVLPQTIYFSRDANGLREFETSKGVYGAHPRLTIAARDRRSLSVARQILGNDESRVICAPDIVMYLNRVDDTRKREGALVVLRSDHERIFTDQPGLEGQLVQAFRVVHRTDTALGRPVRPGERMRELDAKLDEFRSAEVVITDRLHGMIMAAITGTACVALDNISGKVSGGFDWLRPLPYIRFLEPTSDIMSACNEVRSAKSYVYDNSHMDGAFARLAQVVTYTNLNGLSDFERGTLI